VTKYVHHHPHHHHHNLKSTATMYMPMAVLFAHFCITSLSGMCCCLLQVSGQYQPW